MLTQKRLREVLNYDPATGVFTWTRGHKKGQVAGTKHDSRGFLKASIDGKRHLLQRPTASEIARMGFDPSKNGHGGWFDFVRDMGDPVDVRAITSVTDLLRCIERDRALTAPAITALLSLRDARPPPEEGIAYWAFEPTLRRKGTHLTLTRADPDGAAVAMITELAEWRGATLGEKQAEEAPEPYTGPGPRLWTEYQREEIPQLFGATFSPGNWNSGIVRLDKDLVLLDCRCHSERSLPPRSPVSARHLSLNGLFKANSIARFSGIFTFGCCAIFASVSILYVPFMQKLPLAAHRRQQIGRATRHRVVQHQTMWHGNSIHRHPVLENRLKM
jgi:hypothetical protein